MTMHKNPSEQGKFSTKGDNTICREKTVLSGRDFIRSFGVFSSQGVASSYLHCGLPFRKAVALSVLLQGPFYILSSLGARINE